MKIRKAGKKDKNDLIELMQKADNRSIDWAKERTDSYINNKKKLVLIAEENDKLIGFIGIKEYEDNKARKFANLNNFIWVTWIAVLPQYRNQNIGSQLLKAIDEYVGPFNKLGVILDCRRKVINFYEKNGYSIRGGYIDNKMSRYVMMKELR